jgi:hypothetical protein
MRNLVPVAAAADDQHLPWCACSIRNVHLADIFGGLTSGLEAVDSRLQSVGCEIHGVDGVSIGV